jgi:hypothetical protein
MTTNYLSDTYLDLLLDGIDAACTQLFIDSALCATYAEASSTYKLGVKATPTISAATDDGTTGRKITISAITDGTVSASGDATHVSLCTADALIASYPLNALVAVTSGSTFTLTEHDINLPDPA